MINESLAKTIFLQCSLRCLHFVFIFGIAYHDFVIIMCYLFWDTSQTNVNTLKVNKVLSACISLLLRQFLSELNGKHFADIISLWIYFMKMYFESNFTDIYSWESNWHITVTSKWVQWHLKSPASQWFAHQFVQGQIKENIKAPRHCPLWGKFTGHRWITLAKGQ